MTEMKEVHGRVVMSRQQRKSLGEPGDERRGEAVVVSSPGRQLYGVTLTRVRLHHYISPLLSFITAASQHNTGQSGEK